MHVTYFDVTLQTPQDSTTEVLGFEISWWQTVLTQDTHSRAGRNATAVAAALVTSETEFPSSCT